jgi:hypothetical protein
MRAFLGLVMLCLLASFTLALILLIIAEWVSN